MMQTESAMEKGEAGLPLTVSPAPTTPTLTCHDSTSSDKAILHPEKAQKRHFSLPRGLSVPSWIPFGRAQQNFHAKTNTRRLNDCAKGYPNLGAFIDSDEGFSLFRRFGYLQCRLLLGKQEELRRLETRLDKFEARLARGDSGRFCQKDQFGPEGKKHQALLADIEDKFCSYSKLLIAAQQMMAFNKPADADYRSVGLYIHNRKPLIEEEESWIQHKEDMITLRAGREHAWLDDVVEGLLRRFHCRPIDWLFRSEETRKKAEIDSPNMLACPPPEEDKHEIYYTPSRIAKLSNSILTFMVLVLLILPIYVLYHMVHDVGTRKAYMACIGTLVVFTLAFSSVLSLFTKAKRHEILAAAAAYCAVLVVFLGNVSPGSER